MISIVIKWESKNNNSDSPYMYHVYSLQSSFVSYHIPMIPYIVPIDTSNPNTPPPSLSLSLSLSWVKEWIKSQILNLRSILIPHNKWIESILFILYTRHSITNQLNFESIHWSRGSLSFFTSVIGFNIKYIQCMSLSTPISLYSFYIRYLMDDPKFSIFHIHQVPFSSYYTINNDESIETCIHDMIIVVCSLYIKYIQLIPL